MEDFKPTPLNEMLQRNDTRSRSPIRKDFDKKGVKKRLKEVKTSCESAGKANKKTVREKVVILIHIPFFIWFFFSLINIPNIKYMKKRDRIWLLIYLSILSIVIVIVVSFIEQKY